MNLICKICGRKFISFSNSTYIYYRCIRIESNKILNGLCNVIEKKLKVYEVDEENNMTRLIHYGYGEDGLPEIKSYGEWFNDK